MDQRMPEECPGIGCCRFGVTEETDCLSLVVSEETGRISVAAFGEIESNLTLDQVRAKLDHHFGWKGRRSESAKNFAHQPVSHAKHHAGTDRA